MRENPLRHAFAAGRPVISGWISMPSSYGAEIVAHAGVDAVCVDLQHGMIWFESAVAMLQAISASPATPLARAADTDPAMIMKLLDAGAYGIICPMVSTSDDARRFVAACRYPPAGERSFGPARGLLYGGADYFAHADDEVLTIAMIETRAGLENAAAIAAVDGLDALFIGPNDLALALGHPPLAESDVAEVKEAITDILAAGRVANKPVGIFCSTGEAARRRLEEGFAFVVPGNDAGQLRGAVSAAVTAARGG